MLRFILKRVLQAIFVIVVVTLLVSYAVRLTGDPAVIITSGSDSISTQDLQNIRNGLGLNRPFSVQYLSYMAGMLHGDFGHSFMGGTPVSRLLATALPATLILTLVTVLGALLISIPLGVYSATRRGRAGDQVVRIVSLVGLSFPNFWLAMMLVLGLSIFIPIFPPAGYSGASSVMLPGLTMAIVLSAIMVRLVRTTMLDTLGQPFIMVARSKGLREWVVLYKHALRNCAIPLITYLGSQFGSLIGGIVVVERVFNWPGMGTLAFDAIANRDYPVLQGTVTVLAILIIVVNLVIDLAYGIIDPRIRKH